MLNANASRNSHTMHKFRIAEVNFALCMRRENLSKWFYIKKNHQGPKLQCLLKVVGPSIHKLVTGIQVNVYIGNTLSRLSFQNWRMLKIK